MSGESVYRLATGALIRIAEDVGVPEDETAVDFDLIDKAIKAGEAAEKRSDEATVALTMIAEWVRAEKARHGKKAGGQTCGDTSPRVLPSALIELDRMTRIEDARYAYEEIAKLITRAETAEARVIELEAETELFRKRLAPSSETGKADRMSGESVYGRAREAMLEEYVTPEGRDDIYSALTAGEKAEARVIELEAILQKKSRP